MTEITPELEQNPTIAGIRAWRPEAIADVSAFKNELTVTVRSEHLRPLCQFLATDPNMAFTMLEDITCVDRLVSDPRFELNYQLLSLKNRASVRIRVRLPGPSPVVDSVVSVWPTANWHERESFDLFGIHFEGHPDLRRMLMPDDWEGYPLRKDYPTEGPRGLQGMDT